MKNDIYPRGRSRAESTAAIYRPHRQSTHWREGLKTTRPPYAVFKLKSGECRNAPYTATDIAATQQPPHRRKSTANLMMQCIAMTARAPRHRSWREAALFHFSHHCRQKMTVKKPQLVNQVDPVATPNAPLQIIATTIIIHTMFQRVEFLLVPLHCLPKQRE